jgi:hypothetical protein
VPCQPQVFARAINARKTNTCGDSRVDTATTDVLGGSRRNGNFCRASWGIPARRLSDRLCTQLLPSRVHVTTLRATRPQRNQDVLRALKLLRDVYLPRQEMLE